MAKSRIELDAAIEELAAWVPAMLSETDEVSQMHAFAGRADLISQQAAPEDQCYLWSRLQAILKDHCLIPADEGPCA